MKQIASLSLASALLLGCADRDLATSLEAGETGSPFEEGALFSGCLVASDCAESWCLHPADESGFCTHPCSTAADCSVDISASADAICVAVEADLACGLDCSGGKECPSGMRCEQIEDANGDARSICF